MKIKKIITTLIIATILLVQNSGLALAQEVVVPTAPPAPTAPSLPQNNNTIPTAPPLPSAPPLPTAPPAPTAPPLPSTTPVAAVVPTAEPQTTNENNNSNSGGTTNSQNNEPAATAPATTGSGNQTQDGGNGGEINTGNADNSGSIVTNANNNSAIVPTGDEGGITVKNDGNGADSQNSGSANIVENNQTSQNNSANVVNNLNLGTTTGDNSMSSNTGGNSNIKTGDANTSGTIITAVNTNIDGVAVSEFNIVDDHVGDVILDFAANCISGCGGLSGTVQNTGNGADSQNQASLVEDINNETFQNNDATVENNMFLSSDSGSNKTNRNTGGDSNITTGDANVSANALTFANNNIAGNVYYGVVNVYGDLVGDIVLPESALASVGLLNTGNGAGSTNNANVDQSTTNSTEQFNNANIDNNLNFVATTGDNDASRNTDGTSNVDSGDASLTAQVLNVANTNVVGGNMWLVIVNEAGQWIGRILGAPEGSNYAGSAGTEFRVGENGEITATNAGNGADSTNNANISSNQTNTTTQNNDANIVNNINLSANTGKNEASRNTGGNSNITTGDANIVANLVNFVNNNISGGGKLFVTVVNVFGSWLGDFVTPGQTQNTANTDENNNQEHAIGGVSENQSSNIQTQGGASVETITQTTTASNYNLPITANNKLFSPSSNFSETSEDGEVLGVAVAGDILTNPVESSVAKSIKINLAWGLLALPVLLLLVTLRKRKTLLALLPLKGRNGK